MKTNTSKKNLSMVKINERVRKYDKSALLMKNSLCACTSYYVCHSYTNRYV